jgi:hypothetical protein
LWRLYPQRFEKISTIITTASRVDHRRPEIASANELPN